MKSSTHHDSPAISPLTIRHSLEYRTRLIGPSELDLLCRLEHELFLRGPFAESRQAIYRRNLSIFEVNALAFAVVEANVHDTYVPIGMSSILPLNAHGEALYCVTEGLKDIELRGRHVAAPGEWSNAILIFIVGFTGEVRGLLRDRPLAAIANVVFDHGSRVVAGMRVHHPDQRRVRLLAQTNRANGGMNRLFQRGGSSTGIVTGDGYPLRELIVELPSEMPDRGSLSGALLSAFERVTTARSAADIGV